MHTFYWVPHQMPMHYALIYKMNKNKTVLMTLESWRTVDMDKLHEEAPSERRSTCRSTAEHVVADFVVENRPTIV